MISESEFDRAALGRRLRQRRKALGMSQRELGRSAGVTAAFVSGVEQGERLPSLDTFVRLCACLGLSLDALALGDSPCAAEQCRLLQSLKRLVDEWTEAPPACRPAAPQNSQSPDPRRPNG